MASPSLSIRATVGFVVAFGVSVTLSRFVFGEPIWKALTGGATTGVGIVIATVLVERVL